MTRFRRSPSVLAVLPLILAVLSASDRARAAAVSADVSVTKVRTSPTPAHPGDHVTWDITVSNGGPDTATNVVWSDTIPDGMTFDEVDPPNGIICIAPVSGGTGTVTCTIPSLAASTSSGPYHLQTDIVTNDPAATIGVIENDVTVTADTPDPNSDNNSAFATVVGTPRVVVPMLSGVAFSLLGAAVALAGLLLLRR